MKAGAVTERTVRERIVFHHDIEVMEIDFSGLTFEHRDEIDAFYDEVDRQLEASGRRWFFLVDYSGCMIRPVAWDHFAARGKHSNVTYSLGTARVGTSVEIRKSIRERATRERFRANIFETRDQALVALGDKKKHQRLVDGASGEDFLSVRDIRLHFGGVRALEGVGFSVQKGEIFAMIGPNGAGKSSLLNEIGRAHV